MEFDTNAALAQQQATNLAFQTPASQMGGSAVLMLTNPGEITHSFELFLRGKKEDENGKLVSIGKPIMNDGGCYMFVSYLTSIVNQINMLGNISVQEKMRLLDFNDEDIELLHCDWAILGLSSIPNVRTAQSRVISKMMTNLFYVALNRPQDEGDRRFLKGTQHEFSFNQTGASKKDGGLAGMISSLKKAAT